MLSLELRESGHSKAAMAANGELDCHGVFGDISDIRRKDKGLAFAQCMTTGETTLMLLLLVLSNLENLAAVAAGPQSGQCKQPNGSHAHMCTLQVCGNSVNAVPRCSEVEIAVARSGTAATAVVPKSVTTRAAALHSYTDLSELSSIVPLVTNTNPDHEPAARGADLGDQPGSLVIRPQCCARSS